MEVVTGKLLIHIETIFNMVYIETKINSSSYLNRLMWCLKRLVERMSYDWVKRKYPYHPYRNGYYYSKGWDIKPKECNKVLDYSVETIYFYGLISLQRSSTTASSP